MKFANSSAALMLACAFAASLPLPAQSTQSSLLGTITDATGAAMAGVAGHPPQ